MNVSNYINDNGRGQIQVCEATGDLIGKTEGREDMRGPEPPASSNLSTGANRSTLAAEMVETTWALASGMLASVKTYSQDQ